jgi:phenylpropionate dioxygenase-like ring-hydroxylating dioxygenase large terminal subunit
MERLSQELFDSFEASVTSVDQACMLPAAVYTSEAFFRFELEAVYGHDWLCVGRTDQIRNHGDFLATEIAGEPMLIVRDRDAIHALSAVCQHRGMVVAQKSGNQKRFTCPYHHWNYGLDGRLLGAPHMERTAGFNQADYCLPRLRTEIWKGFIFVNLDRNAAPLAPSLAEIEPLLEHFELDVAVTRAGKTIPDLPWNWKIMLENFNDPYHASHLHAPLQTFAPSGMSDFFDWREGMNHISRIQHFTQIDGSFNPTKKCLLPVFPKLTEAERKRGMFVLVPPTLALAIVPDEIAYFIVKPQGASAITIEISYCFNPQALRDPMFEYLFAQAEAGVDNFNRQDVYANTMVHRGLVSRHARRGRYSWQEATLPQFNRWLVSRYRKYWPRPAREHGPDAGAM